MHLPSFIRTFVLLAMLASLTGCGIHEPGDTDPRVDADGPTSAPSSEHDPSDRRNHPEGSAGGIGFELSLPFSSDTGCVLTRAYCSAKGPWPTDIDPDGTNWCSHRATARYNDAYALDFACPAGTPVVAVADGTVAQVIAEEKNWGHHVLIDHGSGVYSLYGHLQRIDVREGQRIRQSQTIGGMGSTGYSTGPHVHFSLMRGNGPEGPFDALIPEPISGHEDLHEAGRRVYGASASFGNLPVGSILKAHDSPRIYVVCDDMTICHVADWEAFADRRLFHEAHDPLDRVIMVSSETLSCYREGETVSGRSVRAVIGCGRVDWLYLDEGGKKLRRRIPFDRDAERASYDALLRSWGFTREERREGSFSECLVNIGEDLRLRDGTLIELASDNDFYVVTSDRWDNEADYRTDDGFVRRVHRERDGSPFMPYLYRGYGQVIIVPDDAVFTMTNGMRHGENIFGPAEASSCRYGLDRSGGSAMTYEGTEGEPHEDVAGYEAEEEFLDPSDPHAQDLDPCGDDAPHDEEGVPDAVAQDEDTDDVGSDDGEPIGALSHAIECRRSGEALIVTLHGPVLDGLHGGTVASPQAIQFGSNRPFMWDLPYDPDDGRALVPWQGDGATHVLRLPGDVEGFNFFVTDGHGGGRWFDLDESDGDGSAWEAVGECHREGTLISTIGK